LNHKGGAASNNRYPLTAARGIDSIASRLALMTSTPFDTTTNKSSLVIKTKKHEKQHQQQQQQQQQQQSTPTDFADVRLQALKFLTEDMLKELDQELIEFNQLNTENLEKMKQMSEENEFG
jgi:DNA anti-recombination protein RmuC